MKTGKMRFGYRLTGWTSTLFFKVVFGLRIYGRENVPITGKLLVVSNHLSNFDPPVVGGIVPREIYFAAKIQLFKGLLGKLITYLNAIPVRRTGSDKEAIKALAEKLKEDKAVLIFPEGTRTLDPEGIKPKAGVGMLAVMSGADLIPVRVTNSENLKKTFWKRNLKVRFGTPIRLQEVLDKELPRRETYTYVTERLMEQIHAMKELDS
ncbi:1-acyl-sn-glycerol-3-phosphate acyltransferase [bacterium]|nr:1-acyl-sn-glycerol-3-phosphate acyltransferase [bacterium]